MSDTLIQQRQITTQLNKLIKSLERAANELQDINHSLVNLHQLYTETKIKKKDDKRRFFKNNSLT